jgi:hypothetical protein
LLVQLIVPADDDPVVYDVDPTDDPGKLPPMTTYFGFGNQFVPISPPLLLSPESLLPPALPLLLVLRRIATIPSTAAAATPLADKIGTNDELPFTCSGPVGAFVTISLVGRVVGVVVVERVGLRDGCEVGPFVGIVDGIVFGARVGAPTHWPVPATQKPDVHVPRELGDV